MAVGDGLNDLDMLEFAGLGVAMGSGHPGLKSVADGVTAGLKEDGVAVLIEQLIAEGAL
ncbi:MAG: family hydrolase [Cyanobacteria bacterium RYN_339]|nr:family hydrolase [Cyanobacteria bacterium RYN_339]